MLNFKKLNKFDRLMAVITFAEAGEAETAIMLMDMDKKKEQKRWLSNPTINLTADFCPILPDKKEGKEQRYFPQEEEITRRTQRQSNRGASGKSPELKRHLDRSPFVSI